MKDSFEWVRWSHSIHLLFFFIQQIQGVAKVGLQLWVGKTVYSCIINYCIIFHMNCKPTFATPCVPWVAIVLSLGVKSNTEMNLADFLPRKAVWSYLCGGFGASKNVTMVAWYYQVVPVWMSGFWEVWTTFEKTDLSQLFLIRDLGFFLYNFS